MKQTVTQNTVYLTSAFIAQRFFSFIFFTLIARYVGVENTGAYVFALSYTTLFGIFGDLGLSSVLIRETARDKNQSAKLLQNVLSAKLVLLAVTIIAALAVLPFLNKPSLINSMVYLAILVMFFDSLTLSFWGAFRGWQNLKFEAMSVVVAQILILIVGALVIFTKQPIQYLILAIFAGSIYQFFASSILLTKNLGLKIWPRHDWPTLSNLFKIALPFALSGIFTRFYSYLDQILLSVMAGERALGLYSVPYKITFALQFVPQALGAALFPAMSDYYVTSKEKLARLFERSMFYLMLFAIPAAVGIGVLAEPIILKIYGPAYQPSIFPLQIMMSSLIFVFLSFPVGALLNAGNMQSKQTGNLALTMVSNAVLNLILIPRYSYLGSSVAVVVSMAVLFFSGLYWSGRIIEYQKVFLLKSFVKAVIGAAIMGAIIWYIKDPAFLAGKIKLIYQLIALPVLGAVIYTLVMILIKGVKKSDLAEVWQAFVRKI